MSTTAREITGRVDDIDGQVERIHNLIEHAARIDPELGAGMATTESMTGVQKKADALAACAESLSRHLKSLRRD